MGEGQSVPAVILPTKQGDIFVLDRRTGEPLTEVQERPVPASKLPDEQLSPTQPFSVGMPTLAKPKLTERDAWGFSPRISSGAGFNSCSPTTRGCTPRRASSGPSSNTPATTAATTGAVVRWTPSAASLSPTTPTCRCVISSSVAKRLMRKAWCRWASRVGRPIPAGRCPRQALLTPSRSSHGATA